MKEFDLRLRYAEPSLGTALAIVEVVIYRSVRDTITSPFRLLKYLEKEKSWTWLEFVLVVLLLAFCIGVAVGISDWALRQDSRVLFWTIAVWCVPQMLYLLFAHYWDICDPFGEEEDYDE